MTCAHCVDAADLFGARMARRELKRYRRRGPSRSTRLLLRALRQRLPEEAHLMDIGGGIGAIQHELLDGGVLRVTGVDASPAYVAAAEDEARRRGHGEQVHHVMGDAVELGDELPDADLVTLDRVLCCYPDMPALVAVSAARAGHLWGVVFPRENVLVGLGVRVINLLNALQRKEFRVYLHGRDRIEAEAERSGLRLVESERTLLWNVQLYERVPEA